MLTLHPLVKSRARVYKVLLLSRESKLTKDGMLNTCMKEYSICLEINSCQNR